MRIIILGLFGLLLLAPPAFPQTSASASHGGCLVRADLTVLEIIPGACAPKIVKALAESLDLVCTPALQEEAASLSVAAATNQGLSAKAMARLEVLEVVCPSGPPSPPRPPLFMLGAIPLWLRRRLEAGNLNDRKGQGDVGLPQQVRDIQKRSYPLFDMKQWAVRKTFCLKMSCGCLATLIISDPKNGIMINHSRADANEPFNQEKNMAFLRGRKVRVENGERILPPDVSSLAHRPCLQLPTQGMEDILDGDWDALEAWIQDDLEWFEEVPDHELTRE